jgi:hypothetical protein
VVPVGEVGFVTLWPPPTLAPSGGDGIVGGVKNAEADLIVIIVKLIRFLPYAIAKLIGSMFLIALGGGLVWGAFLISNEILIFIFGETIADKPSHDMYGPDRRIPDLSLWIYFPLIPLLCVVISTPFILALARYVLPHIERLDRWVEEKLYPR